MTAMAHLRFLLILLWVGVTVGNVVDLHKRIIGGRDCHPDEHQHHVALVANNEAFCGGSLIRNGWILTAAHCLQSIGNVDVSLTRNNFHAEATITDAFEFHDRRCHDLMLLRLPDTACIPQGVHHIELPDCSRMLRVNDMVNISGHGSNMMGPMNQRRPGFIPILQCVEMRVTDHNPLRQQIQTENTNYIYQHWLAAQFPGRDICFRDSGGGWVFNGRIYGVQAFTGDGDFGCLSPAGFMDLCHPAYFQWITDTTQTRRVLPNC